jgi:hypothetical protein
LACASDCGKIQFAVAVFAAVLACVRGATLEQHAFEFPLGEGSECDFLPDQAQGMPLLGYASSTFAELVVQLVQMYLGFCFYIPVEQKLVEDSALVLESTCEELLALGSHYLENIAFDASFGSCFLQRV